MLTELLYNNARNVYGIVCADGVAVNRRHGIAACSPDIRRGSDRSFAKQSGIIECTLERLYAVIQRGGVIQPWQKHELFSSASSAARSRVAGWANAPTAALGIA